MKLFNSLSKTTEEFAPRGEIVSIYSCGPTVYDHAHIGNLSAFIFADTLRRTLTANNLPVKHVMNFTDVDDKTIRRSQTDFPDEEPKQALAKTTEYFSGVFLEDFAKIGNDPSAYSFTKATDEENILAMQGLIRQLHEDGFAYIADDGVYFNIEAYKKSGKNYGQLVDISADSTSQARIQNDEYDKENAHDFALWKKQTSNEPSWNFELGNENMTGRPGWHIECSAMSARELGQPFDIHTGGIDLKFPHHENEIAQSTAGKEDPVYAKYFLHNEHILVDGRKMSKSLGNFYTLKDLEGKGVDPLAFRLLVLQSHYRSQTNFSWENLAAATSRLQRWRDIANLRWQIHDTLVDDDTKDNTGRVNGIVLAAPHAALEAMNDDLNSPGALAAIETALDAIDSAPLDKLQRRALVRLIEWIDDVLGLKLASQTPDITEEQKKLIIERERVRDDKNWSRSDELRDELEKQGLTIRDTSSGTIWTRTQP